jgi:glycosyltransferase involved in cell wall biosynthesis
MKICYLAAADSIHSYRWIKYFADKGYEIDWISLAPLMVGDPIKNISIYELRPFSFKGISVWNAFFKVRKIIKCIKPDILHAHYAGTYGLIGAVSGFGPFVVTAWGSDVLLAGKDIIKRSLIKFVLNKADLITCDAEHMRNTMMKLGVNDEKIKIIYFGTDINKFNLGQRCKSLRQKLAIFDSPMIISLRSLEPIYNVETLIKAISLVLKEVPDVKFVIAGKGSQEEYLKNLAKSQGVAGSTLFVGQISNDELPRYLRSSDIYVSTSLSDAGLSASTAEAMASGLPVIVTDTGENRLWVRDGENGILIPPKEPKIFADRILYLIKNKEIRKNIGIMGRKIIEERNNYYIEMEKMEMIYNNLTKTHV